MQLSVIILNYNVRYFVQQCILSVQKALKDIDSEIIVVDNASADDSCAMIKEYFPEVVLIENKENSGFPKGNNIGVEHAKGKYICILNPDTVVSEDTFIKLLDFAQTRPNLGITGCKFIDGTGNFLPESKRNVPTPKVSLLKMLGKDDLYYANHLSENQSGKVSVVTGAFMFLEKKKYLSLKGFDEDFFMYGEDIDLCYRAEKAGLENYYFADTTIIHYKGESTTKDKIYLKRFYGAMKIFYKKHFPTNILFDKIIDLGVFVFASLNSKKTAATPRVISQYILVSDDEKLLQNIEQKLSKDLLLVSDINSLKINELNTQKTEFIFDENYIPFKAIIAFMGTYKHPNFTFKIRPQKADFLIGSNSNKDKGQVIHL
jgi:GT2 family glycosyltransferase